MKDSSRIRIAALSAAFVLGGLTAAGFGLRAARDERPATAAVHPRTQVIHQTRVRTVHVRPKRARANAAAAPAVPAVTQVPAARPAAVQVVQKVRSRVSPTGGGGEREEGEGEDD